MNRNMEYFIKAVTPPIIFNQLRQLTTRISYTGNYASWEEAQRVTGGYDADIILNRVRDALLKVKNGEAVYERDSVLFDEVHYSWPLLAALLWVVSRSDNRLNLIDFGGSLGSSYYQNLKFLSHLDELQWSIVEQKKFVECGQSLFENDRLRFYEKLDDCIDDRHPDTILFSSVIQYLERPYELLTDVVNRGFTYIIFDRTAFLEKGNDRITIQKVPPTIYPASYPAWFFNRERFLSFFCTRYELMAEFDSFESFRLEDQTAQDKGFIFVKKER